MVPRAHLPPAERRALSRLHALLHQPGILHGSLHEVRRRCGRAGCRCARGALHPACLLRVVEGGCQRTVYVPKDWAPRVQRWIDRDREIRSLLLEISSGYLARIRKR